MTNLLHHFAIAVARHPDRIAIVDGNGEETSFAQLQQRAKRLAAYWQSKGVQKGDRVLLAKPVDADLYASLAALWSLGATVVLPEPAMGLAGLRHAARVTQPKAFCASGVYVVLKYFLKELWPVTLLRPRENEDDPSLTNPDETDIALISFTSGTTGKPKAIPRSHGFLMAQHDAILPLLHSDQPERDLVAFPVFTLINIANGQTSILPNWKMSKLEKLSNAQLVNWITEQKATRALLPPSICAKLIEKPIPPSLKTIFTGGGPVFPDIAQKLRADNGPQVMCVYGSTEAEPIAHLDAGSISRQDDRDMAAGKGLLVGKPVEKVKVRIEGSEILVAGGHVNSGYLDPKHNAENKVVENGVTWHRTGDAGRFDEQGRLWLWGRVGTEITTDSGPLFPFSIEVAARFWPGIEQTALMSVGGQAVLVVQGEVANKEAWQTAAKAFGVNEVKVIAKLPMDTRHRSKIDRNKLIKMLS